MSETQIAPIVSTPPEHSPIENVCHELTSAAASLQFFIDQGDCAAFDLIQSIPAILYQAQETLHAVDQRLHQSETKLNEAQVRVNQEHLLAQVSLTITNSLDYEKQLQAILQVIVPDLADWCAIDLIDRQINLRRVAAAHVDPAKEALVYQNQPTLPLDPHAPVNPQFDTLRSGRALLFADIPFSLVEKSIVDPFQLDIIRKSKPISTIVVPLSAHDRIIGICTFVQSDSGRRYGSADLALVEGIARQAAMSLDNALLYAESQKLNEELERRVEERTTQLQYAISQLTDQMAERRKSEDQVKVLNGELEKRVADRTSQLEVSNRDLKKAVVDHEKASHALRVLLNQTRELYRISKRIGTVRTPNELLKVLMSSSYLKDVSRASIAVFDQPWLKVDAPPEHCLVLADWNRTARTPRCANRSFTLEKYGITLPVAFEKPLIIQDIQSVSELSELVRQHFSETQSHCLIILPLIAGGEWYGLLSLHFKTRRIITLDDPLHLRGLVDETAIVIKNMRLLVAESKARQEAEKANNLKLQFLGMISHELRTPLTSIKGFATTLLAEDVAWSREKQRDFLEIINRESDKLHDLIEQLLDLSRMEAGVLRISQETMSMGKILDSALTQLQSITAEHQLVLDVQPGLPPVLCDGQRTAQVLTNVVSNAAKYSPPQTKIIISVRHLGEKVQVDVADRGPGISPQDRVRVFEAFRQLENGTGNRTKGAGLGLAICKGLIEAQNGKIWIHDRGPGAVVSFTLPVSAS